MIQTKQGASDNYLISSFLSGLQTRMGF